MAWLLVLVPALIVGGFCFIWRDDKVGRYTAVIIPALLALIGFAYVITIADVNGGWSLATVAGWLFITAIAGAGGLAGFFIGESLVGHETPKEDQS
ncbi:hypothetical protein [Salinibius halmophilus]|uniref:hypothetical protein n=1 Tax=Salinibius halmophilus TaxID=1853216 RepID=UPI000E66324A|nr:hypothetical protein [Salinibius halmophilus]